MIDPSRVVTGERIQLRACDVFCGLPEDFRYNPAVRWRWWRQRDLRDVPAGWANPRHVFLYTHRLQLFQDVVDRLRHPFVLVTHNSDANVEPPVTSLADHPLVVAWHAQNACFSHPKVVPLPIGMANRMWRHGDVRALCRASAPGPKPGAIHCQFDPATHRAEREACRSACESRGIPFVPRESFPHYLRRLAAHRFAVCPPGNGADTHRLWECLYLRVVPIVLRSAFITALERWLPPRALVILERWDELDPAALLRAHDADPQVFPAVDGHPLLDIQRTIARIRGGGQSA